MNFDFALILVVATGLCGAVWLLDRVWLAPQRRQRLETAQAQAGGNLPQETVEQLNREPGWVDTGKSMFPVLAVVLVLRSFLIEPFQIPSGSMLPTLNIGDFILVNKYHYGIRLPVSNTKIIPINDPKRGDIAVFRYPQDPSVNYIKRVVGLPGDRIRYMDKTLYINGEAQPQQLVAQLPPAEPQQLLLNETLGGVKHRIYQDLFRPRIDGEVEVPEGHYFVMGDNRDNSNDSRMWGFVPDELLVGKAFAVWVYWPERFSIPDFSEARFIQ
ncbi:signal peptidase I [Marinobacterium arenosum]|uniref:signal peptidase I n=1 Tax=Marinobacterium arenosum TaxID=2862496 RepID=UPI001C979B79|nr:signal peptidase I [Marinobacterium arenosum]MBY4676785.1 signal peptidase I [Marinobacterium arenosum]